MHEIHEEREKGKIKSTYQVKEAWMKTKMKREEGFQGEEGSWVESGERERDPNI